MILTINNLIALNNRSVRIGILPNADGFDLPETSVSMIETPFAERSELQSIRFKNRQIKLKCVITESSLDNYFDLRDALQQQLHIKDGLINFTITTFETVPRSFNFSGTCKIDLPIHRVGHGEFDLTIICPDPFLYAQNSVTSSINFTQAGLFVPFKLPNFLGGAGNNTIVVNNTGNYTTFANITLTGSGQNFSIINQTTGKTTLLGYYLNDFNLSDMRTVTIDGINKRVTDQSGSNRYNYLKSFGALELAKGNNTFVFSVQDLNNANTSASISFLPRFTHI